MLKVLPVHSHKNYSIMDSLEQYVKVGSLEDVKKIINKGELKFVSDSLGYNLLKKSLIYKQKKIAQFFIENNFQLNPSFHAVEETPLHIAVKLRWKDIVELLLEKGASVEVQDNLNHLSPVQLSFSMKEYELTDLMLPYDKGYVLLHNKNKISHLHIACARNHVDILKKYLQLGQNIFNVIDSTNTKWAGYTSLHFAVEFRRTETVKVLLKCGADITAKDQKGNTPLHLAVELQNELLIDLILSQHMYKYKNPEDVNKLSHFHIACIRNNSKIVHVFLQSGVDVNAKVVGGPWAGFTALHLAVVHQCTNVIKLLLAQGSCSKNYTQEFLFDLYDTKNVEIQNLVFSINEILLPEEYTEEIPPIFKACIFEQLRTIRSLIQMGASVNKYLPLNSSLWPGATPLHIVVANKSDNTAMVNLLLQNRADVSAIDAGGETPIHVAFKMNLELTRCLLQYYSNLHINLADEDGLSLFHIACANNSIDVVDRFLSFENNGVDVNAKVSDNSIMYAGFTPLHIAVRHGSSAVVKMLLQHNVDLGLRNCFGVAPFNLIHMNDNMMMPDELFPFIVMMLKKAYETNCTSFDSWGFNPLHVACMAEDEETVERYVVNQSMINATIDKQSAIYRGFTPLHFAVLSNNSKIIDILLNHGADSRIRNFEGDTPLHMIIHPEYRTSVEDFKMHLNVEGLSEPVDDRLFVLEENPFGSMGYSHFHIACLVGKLDIVKSYLSRGVEPNLRTGLCHNMRNNLYFWGMPTVGETGLHLAASVDQHKVMLLLLEHGADVNARDATLRVPLHCVSWTPKSHETATLLLGQSHVDVNAPDYALRTPLHTVCRHGTVPDVLQAFINAGADVNLIDSHGQVALHHCIKHCEKIGEMVKVLVEHMIRLDEAGCPVTERNLNCLSKQILPLPKFDEEKFRASCKVEVKRMEYLRQTIGIKNPHELKNFVAGQAFRRLVKVKIAEYPMYGEWLKRQYERGLRTKKLVNDITPAIKKLSGPKYSLSDEFAEAILQYLTVDELEQLKQALTSCFPSLFSERRRA